MRIALIDSNRKTKLYSIALLKLGAWQKNEGNECQMFDNVLPKSGAFDQIWISTVFTFDIPYSTAMAREAKKRADHVRIGGIAATLLPRHFRDTGADTYEGLLPEAEVMRPDYSLLPAEPETSITYTSRGCARKCKFCMVPTLEPVFTHRDWVADLHPTAKKIQFFDNNWFAKKRPLLYEDIERLHDLVKAKRISEIDFNQGLDCRFVNEEIAKRLEGLPITPVRFAFDGMQEDGHYQRAIKIMADHGFHTFRNYILYNFEDHPKDLYYRLRETAALQGYGGATVEAFPMRYQPIMDVDPDRGYIGRFWNRTRRANFQALMGRQASTGVVNTRSMEEFEYWFGETDEEFLRIIDYPKARELYDRKRAVIRIMRAKKRANPELKDLSLWKMAKDERFAVGK